MKNPSRIAGIFFCFLGCACDGPQAPPAKPPEAPSAAAGFDAHKITKADLPPLVVDESAGEEYTMPADSLMAIITAGNAREAGRAMRELARRRTDESCTLLIKVLREQASHLPAQPPSLEEAKRVDEGYLATRKYPPCESLVAAFWQGKLRCQMAGIVRHA